MCAQRDFDLLGYKYSILSSIATAGLNHVVCMIPARDPSEFALFPEADKAWIRHWLQWTDAHNQTLARQMPIPNLPQPQIGAVGCVRAYKRRGPSPTTPTKTRTSSIPSH